MIKDIFICVGKFGYEGTVFSRSNYAKHSFDLIRLTCKMYDLPPYAGVVLSLDLSECVMERSISEGNTR